MKELDIIKTIKETLSNSSLIGDDTACVNNLVMTQDTMVEDVHFRITTISPYELGVKSVAINFSDIAAAGGIPNYILVSISLPKNIDKVFIQELYKGINHICEQNNAIVAGGDVTGGEKISITITAIGSYSDKFAKRSTAKEGDVIIVTGNHGSSKAGFELLEKGQNKPEKFIKAHTMPKAKLKEGQTIIKQCKSPAMMDTSDGLADALFKIGQASNATLKVDFNNIPYDKDIPQDNLIDWVLFGGEDYELLACIAESEFNKLQKKINLYQIGTVTKKQQAPAIININGINLEISEDTLAKGAFDHFKEAE